MLTDNELHQIMSQVRLSPLAWAAIQTENARHSQRPRTSRQRRDRVFPGTNLVPGMRPSSQTIELVAMLDMDYDPDVLAYWARPASLVFSCTLADGIYHSVVCSPGFLVIRRTGAAYEDWTLEGELRKCTATEPGRYTRSVDGRWHCPPGEAAAAAHGLGYIQYSSADINPCVQANLRHLAPYLRAGKRLPALDKGLAAALADVVALKPDITIGDLILKVGQRPDLAAISPDKVADTIICLVLQQDLYINLRRERLTEPRQAHVYAHEAIAQAYEFIMQSSRSGPVSEVRTGLTAEGRELLLKARQRDLALANERYRAISPFVAGVSAQGHIDCDLPRSTRCRLIRQYQEAVCRYSSGYVGLLPAYSNCGRRGPRYDEHITRLVAKHAAKYCQNSCRTTMRAAYNQLQAECRQENRPCPGYAYFAGAVRALLPKTRPDKS